MIDLVRRYEKLWSNHQYQRGQQALVASTIQTHQKELVSLSDALEREKEVLKLLQAVGASTWESTKSVVEAIVTRALKAIFFDRDYRFILTQTVKRGTSSVAFTVADGKMELDLVDEMGGGIVDVVALVLRIAFVTLYRPAVRSLLILDESLKHLSDEYQPYAAKFLRQVCEDLKLDILLVTHKKELTEHAHQVFHISKVDNICVVEEGQ